MAAGGDRERPLVNSEVGATGGGIETTTQEASETQLGALHHHRLPSREAKLYPFDSSKAYVFLGEIPNMPDHCLVADVKTGRIWTG